MDAFSPPVVPKGVTCAAVLAIAATLLLLHAGLAAGDDDEPAPDSEEPWDTGWTFYIDNDALLIGRDQQYTGGFALTLSGRRAAEYPLSLNPALQWLNDRTGLSRVGAGKPWLQRHSLHIGIAGFTPQDTEESDPIRDDRPYANLLFLSNTHQRVLTREFVTYQSSLILGVLGTNVGRGIQNTLHEIGGDDKARGWDNQISDGGELTAGYFATRYETIAWHQESGFGGYQVHTGVGASIGFVTQIDVGVNARWGRYSTRWWEFAPDYAEYIGLGTPLPSRGGSGERDFFIWGGLNLRYSIYNALLQGQFRDSEVTFDRDELHSVLAEASLGLTAGLGDNMHVTLAVRARTPEIRSSEADLPVWGSIVLSQTY